MNKENWFERAEKFFRKGYHDIDWNHKMVRSKEAWAYSESLGKTSRGEGILIGHIDSGYLYHPELDDDRIVHDLEYDLYWDPNPQPYSAKNEHGGTHGLSTGSVLMSGERGQMAGIAPLAKIVPLKITRKGAAIFIIPIGAYIVGKAIDYAAKEGCHVISMSLGGIRVKSEVLHMIIKHAVERKNVIICSAAGNIWPWVSWPAKYDEIIAVAACTARKQPWSQSASGPKVNVTAPGHKVWRAYKSDARDVVQPGSGTSYATPHVAGIAALWLAHHDRDLLIHRYNGIPLSYVFAKVINESCDELNRTIGKSRKHFGAGVVIARRVLETKLPEAEEVRDYMASMQLKINSVPLLRPYLEVFDTLSEDELRSRLANIINVKAKRLDRNLDSIDTEELISHIVSTPILSEFMEQGKQSKMKEYSINDILLQQDLSDELRNRLN